MAVAVMALVQGYSPSPRDIAPIDMKSSCMEEAAVDVNRGAAFLMALAPLDARRAFNRAAERDPDCALAGWGRAMSWLPVDPWRMSQLALREGRDALRRVAGRGTPREQAYVKSAAALFDDAGSGTTPVPIGTRLARYRDATRNLAAEFVDDQFATIVFARATLLLSTVPGDDSAREAATIIERRFGVEFPSTQLVQAKSDNLQLGAALTLLLARDGPTLADTSKGAADAVARMATLPLARHLPSRTYTRLGDWTAAAASTEAAIKLAGTPASPELVHGIDRRDVAGEWLVEAYLQQGRFAKADSLIAEIRRALDAGVGAEDARGARGDVRRARAHARAIRAGARRLDERPRSERSRTRLRSPVFRDFPAFAVFPIFAVFPGFPVCVIFAIVFVVTILCVPAGVFGGAARLAWREGRPSQGSRAHQRTSGRHERRPHLDCRTPARDRACRDCRRSGGASGAGTAADARERSRRAAATIGTARLSIRTSRGNRRRSVLSSEPLRTGAAPLQRRADCPSQSRALVPRHRARVRAPR